MTQTKTALLVLKAVLLPFMRKQSALSSRILPETSHIRYHAGIVCPKSDTMLSSGRESCLETLIKRIDDFTLIGVTKNVALGSTDINLSSSARARVDSLEQLWVSLLWHRAWYGNRIRCVSRSGLFMTSMAILLKKQFVRIRATTGGARNPTKNTKKTKKLLQLYFRQCG